MHFQFTRAAAPFLFLFSLLVSPIAQAEVRSSLVSSVEKKNLSVEGFWRRAEELGTPLIEAGESQATTLLTFVYRAPSGSKINLESDINSLLIENTFFDFDTLGRMENLRDTDIHFISIEVSNKLRTEYAFVVDGELKSDPLNKSSGENTEPGSPWRVIALADAPPQPWRAISEGGEWKKGEVSSDILGGKQTIYVYLPLGYRPNASRGHPVVIAMDSVAFGLNMPSDRIVEHLFSKDGARSPILVLAPDLSDFADGNGYAPAADFLAEELLGWAREEFNLSRRRNDVVVVGLSRRGLIAAYTALKHSEQIGGAISLSGAFYWSPESNDEPEWFARVLAETEKRPVRYYLGVGELETVVTPRNRGHYMLSANRHVRNILSAKDYDYAYSEFYGGHNVLNWENEFAAALNYIFLTQE